MTRREAGDIARQAKDGFREWTKRRPDQPPHWASKRRDRRAKGEDSGQDDKTPQKGVSGPAKGNSND